MKEGVRAQEIFTKQEKAAFKLINKALKKAAAFAEIYEIEEIFPDDRERCMFELYFAHYSIMKGNYELNFLLNNLPLSRKLSLIGEKIFNYYDRKNSVWEMAGNLLGSKIQTIVEDMMETKRIPGLRIQNCANFMSTAVYDHRGSDKKLSQAIQSVKAGHKSPEN